MHVVEEGDPAARSCFLLIHGIGTSSRYYAALAHLLATQSRVVSLDLPGFGSSSRPLEVLTMGDLAAVVDAVAHRLGLADPVLVGHSMGCQVVAELDARRPGRARGLVLIGPTVDPDKRGVVRHVAMLSVNSLFEPWRVNRIILGDYVRCGVRQYVKTLRPMLAHRIERRLRASGTRTVVVRGRHDMVALRGWTRAASAMPAHGAFLEIPGAAHAVHAVRTREVAEACLDLVRA